MSKRSYQLQNQDVFSFGARTTMASWALAGMATKAAAATTTMATVTTTTMGIS